MGSGRMRREGSLVFSRYLLGLFMSVFWAPRYTVNESLTS